MILRALPLLLLALSLPAAAQETGRTLPLEPPAVFDLVFRVTDLSGNPVSAVAGTVQDLQVRQIGNELRIDLAADVLFDFDKADILPKAEQTLRKAAAIIKERAKGTVLVAGHTDSKGGASYNLQLSERRASSVRDWLRTRGGLAGFTFDTKGLGATQPVVPNQKPDGSDDPEGRQKNRRVEITIKT